MLFLNVTKAIHSKVIKIKVNQKTLINLNYDNIFIIKMYGTYANTWINLFRHTIIINGILNKKMLLT